MALMDEVLRVVALQRAIGGQGAIKLAQQTLVVDDEAELLLGLALLVEPVHPRDRLQQVVFLQRLADVEDRVAGRVEPGQQLGDHDEDFGVAWALERVDDPAVVLGLRAVARHRFVPENAHPVLRRFVDLLVPFALVGRGDDDLTGHVADLVEHLLEADGGDLGRGDELGLEAGALPVAAEVLGDVAGDGPGGDLLADEARLVEHRHDDAVLDRLVDWVAVDQAAERGDGALLAGEERGSGEAEVAGLGKEAAHLHGELAVAAEGSRGGTAALVDEDEEVGVIVRFGGVPEGRVELVDEGGDEGGAVADEGDEVTAASRADRYQVAGFEGVADLMVQIGAVGDEDDSWVDDVVVEGECPAEHEHGEGLA